MKYKAVVIGASAGGMKAIKTILSVLPASFTLPIIIVQHINAQSDSTWISGLNNCCTLPIHEAGEKEKIARGSVYFAPPGYHLLIEKDKSFTITSDERVNFARPSIDVMFETAADAYKEALVGIILTGSNADGAKGLKSVKQNGGLTIVQDPKTAEADKMPLSAIAEGNPDYILSPEKVVNLLIKIESYP